jgi:hypothetical protein
VALDQRDVRRILEPVRHAAVRLRDDLVLPRLDARHVDADRTLDHDAEVACAARDVRGAGARDQRLRRDATVFTHVPPTSLRSRIASCGRRRQAAPPAKGPACPVPMTIASKRSVI